MARKWMSHPLTDGTNSAAWDADSAANAIAGGQTGTQILPDAHQQAILNVPGIRNGWADFSNASSNASSFEPVAPAITVMDGATAEIDGASAQSVTFAATTGTLKLDDATAYTGQVSGLTGSDALDFADVSYGPDTTATFLGNASGGTLTVTNGTETAHVALVGDYLTSGWTLFSDGHGGTLVVDPPLNTTDGSANAPAGTPQLPHLLDVNSPSTQTYGETYVTRPSWNVAGVDYYVGVPAGTALNDPVVNGVLSAALVAQGCSLSDGTITCSANNQTISGWDFTGYSLQLNGSGDIAENNNFAFTSSSNANQIGCLIGVGSSAVNTTILDNTLQGNGYGVIGLGLIDSNGVGTITIEHNQIDNAFAENLVVGNVASSGFNLVLQYNLIRNAGIGFSEGAHGDWIQITNVNSNDVINSLNINYNTWI